MRPPRRGRRPPQGGGRRRRVHMLTGLVLPVWEAVQSALADLHRASDRRLRVLRLQTTGALLRRPVTCHLDAMQLPCIPARDTCAAAALIANSCCERSQACLHLVARVSADTHAACVCAGENSLRLVGMHLPNVAVDTVLENLQLLRQRQFGHQAQLQAPPAKISMQTSYPPAGAWPQGSIILD